MLLRIGVHLVSLGMAGLVGCSSAASGRDSECSVSFPVYDAYGKKLQFAILRVLRIDSQDGRNLLQTRDGRALGLRADGDRLYFAKAAAGGTAALYVELAGPGSKVIRKTITGLSCGQRFSAQYGNLDSGDDSLASRLSGRVSGCRFEGDWWVNVMPMFGNADTPAVSEGEIGTDGRFDVALVVHGGRYMVVVGKDRAPVIAFPVQITGGTLNNTKDVDLRSACP